MELYQRSSQTLWRTSAGRVVLLAVESGEPPFVVTEPGATLWELLEVASTVPELASILSRTFDADVDEIRVSIEPLLETLVDKRVVQRSAVP
jgi:Coenzyme PQQ synthesis protein D (PqqD)